MKGRKVVYSALIAALLGMLAPISASPPVVPPSQTLLDPDPEEYARFGDDVAVGDVNGDGLDDIIVGAYKSDVLGNSMAGEVFVFLAPDFSQVTRLRSPTPINSRTFGMSVASCDVDGDGLDDVIVGSPGSEVSGKIKAGKTYIFFAPSFTVVSALQAPQPTKFATFGKRVACGDVNGDGKQDVIVGATWHLLRGEAYIFLSPAFSEVITLASPTPEPIETFGDGIAAADLNGDGRDDVLIGAGTSDVDGIREAGEVFIYLTPDFTDIRTLQAPTLKDYANFGQWISTGDVDGDGLTDLAVGASWAEVAGVSYAGEAYIFTGGLPFSGGVALHDPSPEFDARFGHTVILGNFNGDGKDDLLSTAYRADVDGKNGAGEAFLFLTEGVPNLAADALFQDPSPQRGERFGITAAAGDFDGNGIDDLVIGAYEAAVGGLSEAGKVFVYLNPGLT